MDINYLLNKLLMEPSSEFILEIDEKEIPSPVVLQRFLMQNINSPKKLRILNKFVYTLPKQMYLSIVWSLMFVDGEKYNKKHYFKYLKPKQEFEKYKVIHDKVKEQYDIPERDFEAVRAFVDKSIERDKSGWFSYYAVKKSEWYNNDVDYELIKKTVERPVEKQGLSKWF